MTSQKRKAGKVAVTINRSRMSQAAQEEVKGFLLEALDVGENPASINYAVSLTHNLGRYESLRVSVGVTMPCRPTATYQAAEVAKRIAHDVLDVSMDEWIGEEGRRSPHYPPETGDQADEWGDA